MATFVASKGVLIEVNAVGSEALIKRLGDWMVASRIGFARVIERLDTRVSFFVLSVPDAVKIAAWLKAQPEINVTQSRDGTEEKQEKSEEKAG